MNAVYIVEISNIIRDSTGLGMSPKFYRTRGDAEAAIRKLKDIEPDCDHCKQNHYEYQIHELQEARG